MSFVRMNFYVSVVTNQPAPGESDSGDEEHDATTLTPNDYVMLMSKKAISHFVGMIVKNTDEFTNEFEVTFPKCSKKSASVRHVPFDGNVARLPGTARTKKILVLSVDLSQYRPQWNVTYWEYVYGVEHMAYGIGIRDVAWLVINKTIIEGQFV